MAIKQQRVAPFLENIAEATGACLLTMSQGNLLALGISHWIIASQTGITAGVIASVAVLVWNTGKRWLISLVLGVVTAVVDFFMHPGMIGPVFLEAVITGIGAAALSFLVGFVVSRVKTAAATT